MNDGNTGPEKERERREGSRGEKGRRERYMGVSI